MFAVPGKRWLVNMTAAAGGKFHLHSDGPFRQNYTTVVHGGMSRASLHPMAGAWSLPGAGSGGVLSGEGRIVAGGEAYLRRLPGPNRMFELCAAPRRAVRRVGRHERTRATPPQAHGVIDPPRREFHGREGARDPRKGVSYGHHT